MNATEIKTEPTLPKFSARQGIGDLFAGQFSFVSAPATFLLSARADCQTKQSVKNGADLREYSILKNYLAKSAIQSLLHRLSKPLFEIHDGRHRIEKLERPRLVIFWSERSSSRIRSGILGLRLNLAPTGLLSYA